ncbi:MAG: T9SS type A sorting domain-containing protein [Vicingaceae bacterium]
MKVKKIFFGLAIVLLVIDSMGQNVVMRNDTVEVFHGSTRLTLPWASGINSAHFNELDFNLDGKMDLFVFEPNQELNEQTGDKILPFINSGDTAYVYAPQYRSNFKDNGIAMERMAILRDYNCDGKMDIFTHDVRDRVTVYKNVSTDKLEFELVTKILKTDTSGLPSQYWHPGEIYWNWEDVIAFEDIDGDGDIDILTIDFGGSFIEYHKNLSIEKYGICDSLHFEIKNMCWGYFSEDFDSVSFNTCNSAGNVPNPEMKKRILSGGQKGSKHSNTSLLAIDLDGDNVKDLIAGDGIRNHLYAFYNGGKKDSAYMVSYDKYYPPTDSVNLIIYAVPFYVDVDFDGKKDLLVSVRNDQLQDTESSWAYKNVGGNSNPNFSLTTKHFLQGEMIDVGTRSKPVFFDYNQDGLQDLVISNYGYFKNLKYPNNEYTSQLALYENVGALQEPKFQLVDLDMWNLSDDTLNVQSNTYTYGIHPTFGDLDGDGDEDMMVGDYRGKIHYYENSPVGGKAQFSLTFVDFQGIDVGDFSTPQLFDIDKDNKLDLLIGERDGNINYYRNISNGNLAFQKMDDSLGNINVKEWWDLTGFSVPFFYRDDSLNTVRLLAATKVGNIQLYDSIYSGDSLSVKFFKIEESYQDMWDGIYSSIHGADLNNDGSLDFVLGNQSGGVSLFTSEDSIYIPGISDLNSRTIKLKLYPNPAADRINVVVEGSGSDENEFVLFSALGKVLGSRKGTNAVSFDLSNVESGVYFIKVQNKNRPIVLTERFIKIK